jgi:PatG Domain/TIR domain
VAARGKVELFISYSHRDESFKTNLTKHLATLVREESISIWHDREIRTGDKWRGEIDCHLASADIIIFLLSPDFIASSYCFDVEARHALEMHSRGQARLVPVIIRPCEWKRTKFAELQTLPKDGRPVVEWKIRDRAYLEIAKGIREVIGDLTLHSEERVETANKEVLDFAEWLEPEGQSYVYAVGIIEPRFPSRSLRKEFEQAVAAPSLRNMTDRKAFANVLKDPAYRYLVRELCWVLVTGNIDRYVLIPRDPPDLTLLLDSVHREADSPSMDCVIGIQDADAECGAPAIPTVIFDQLYSIDTASFIEAIPRTTRLSKPRFTAVAEELLSTMINAAWSGCGTDVDRALIYLAMRYPAIYNAAADAALLGRRLTAVEVSLLPLSDEGRKIVNVSLSFAGATPKESATYVIGVDVTGKYPFLTSKLSAVSGKANSRR